MISGKDIYDLFAAITPLYVAMIIAYGSVRWWHIFTPDQCSGISRFVDVFAIPLLSFHFISTTNIYNMNYHFIAADSLQKLVIIAALALWYNLPSSKIFKFIASNNTSEKNLDWTITLFSLSTLPNTLVMGIPLLKAMYGDFSGSLMVQIVVLQSVIWYTLMLVLFEYRSARALFAEQFPTDIARSITSFKVDSDVISLIGREPLQADAEMGHDGKVHVTVRRSTSSSLVSSSYNKPANNGGGLTSMTPRASNISGVEIYSLRSSTPRASSFNQTDFYATFVPKITSLNLNSGEETAVRLQGKHRGAGSRSCDFMNGLLYPLPLPPSCSYPAPNPMVSGMGKKKSLNLKPNSDEELHMFMWSSSASPGSEANLRNAVNRAASADFGAINDSNKVTFKGLHDGSGENGRPIRKVVDDIEDGLKSPAGKDDDRAVPVMSTGGGEGIGESGEQQMPPRMVMTRLILIMVWRNLIRNPNTYAIVIGLIWSLVSFGWNIETPTIIKGSISILSDGALGMAMFGLGLFMALQPKIIACGKSVAAFSMAVRFLAGPAVIAATSSAIGLRGDLLRVAIVQAALPQGIVPLVFAKEYNCHPDILSTVVIFGMLIALPITIFYYVLLGV